jgi:hypothetical protein
MTMNRWPFVRKRLHAQQRACACLGHLHEVGDRLALLLADFSGTSYARSQ